jgi:phosphatidylserine/phosphatidylglycerophosphate/cardiolipin synthase-like enzyme
MTSGERSMHRSVTTVVSMVLAAVIGSVAPAWHTQGAGPAVAADALWEVCFTPGGNCAEAIVRAIAESRRSVYVQAYSFTSKPIARALAAAHERGVRVEVILDQSSLREHHAAAVLLARSGVPVFVDAAHVLAHNKVMVIDDETVITGSFNFTYAAQRDNAENLLILHDPALAARYLDNWKAHRGHSEAYAGR